MTEKMSKKQLVEFLNKNFDSAKVENKKGKVYTAFKLGDFQAPKEVGKLHLRCVPGDDGKHEVILYMYEGLSDAIKKERVEQRKKITAARQKDKQGIKDLKVEYRELKRQDKLDDALRVREQIVEAANAYNDKYSRKKKFL